MKLRLRPVTLAISVSKCYCGLKTGQKHHGTCCHSRLLCLRVAQTLSLWKRLLLRIYDSALLQRVSMHPQDEVFPSAEQIEIKVIGERQENALTVVIRYSNLRKGYRSQRRAAYKGLKLSKLSRVHSTRYCPKITTWGAVTTRDHDKTYFNHSYRTNE